MITSQNIAPAIPVGQELDDILKSYGISRSQFIIDTGLLEPTVRGLISGVIRRGTGERYSPATSLTTATAITVTLDRYARDFQKPLGIIHKKLARGRGRPRIHAPLQIAVYSEEKVVEAVHSVFEDTGISPEHRNAFARNVINHARTAQLAGVYALLREAQTIEASSIRDTNSQDQISTLQVAYRRYEEASRKFKRLDVNDDALICAHQMSSVSASIAELQSLSENG